MKKRTWINQFVCIVMSFLVFFATLSSTSIPSFAEGTDTILVRNDFEDGSTQGWVSNTGEISVTNSAITMHTGANSLLYPKRNESWNAPTYDLLSKVKSGDTIKFSAYVYHNSGTGSSKTFQVTVDYISNGSENWVQFAGTQGTQVTNDTWTKIEGTLVVPQGNLSRFTVYPEYSEAGTDGFYVDDVEISKTAAVQTTGVILSNDFEDGTIQGWSTNNPDIVPTSTAVVAHGGSKSLLYPKKVNYWDSPVYNLNSKVKNGDKLKLTLWVYYDSGTDATKTFQITVDQIVNGTESWAQFVGTQGVTVTKGQWTKLEGTYIVPSSGSISKFTAYPEYTGSSTDGFYMDDVEVVNEGTATNGISSDFEDNTTQGWYTQGTAGASVQAASTQGHSGNYGLITTGRQAYYDRPNFELKDKLIKGSTYKYTAWVKFNGTGADDTRKFNIFTCKTDTDHPSGEYTAPTGAYATTAQSGQWTKVEGILPFDYTGTLSSYSMYIEIADENPYGGSTYIANTPIVDFYIDDVTVQAIDPNAPVAIQTDIPDLYKQFEGYFPVGAAMEPYQLDDPLHAQLLAKHFNSLVGENAMKFGSVEPKENTFDFSGADKLVDFAIANNMKVRGHCLAWYIGMPDWLFKHADGTPLEADNADDKQLLLDRLKNHITKTIKHFDDKYGVYGEKGSKNPIYCWDVVNEPINDVDGDFRGNNDGWYKILGTEYIAKAFEYAHATNPNIKLFLNEYSQENAVKGQAIYNLAKDLVDKGAPIDGVGYQAHIDMDAPTIEAMKAVIDKFAALGLEFQITELDMTTKGNNDKNTLIKQGYRYKALFEMFKEEAVAGKLTGVTFWGLADDHNYQNTLIPNSAPTLFDEKLQAKPAYWGVVDPSKLNVYIQTTSIPQGSPRLDTSIDSLWYTVPNFLSCNSFIKGGGTPATIRTMWDSNYLYILAEVKDSTISEKDGLEIFIDRNNSKNTSYEADDGHYFMKRGGACEDGIAAVSKQTSDGYILQTRIPISSITPVQGKSIGFDLRINDYSVNGIANSIAVWNDTSNSMDADTSKLGVLTLEKPTKITEIVKGTPKIDGQIDEIWKGANEISTDVAVSGVNSSKAKVKTLWDDSFLYVLADVTDPKLDKSSINVWEKDSVEIFVDENNAKTSEYQSDDAQYRVNFDNETSFTGGNQQLFRSWASQTNTGYRVEMAIPINKSNINLGRVIGFDVQINDATGGSRTGVSTWNDASGNSYKNTNGFGNAKLLEPTVSNNTVSQTTNSPSNSIPAEVIAKDGVISFPKPTVDSKTHEASITLANEQDKLKKAFEDTKQDNKGVKTIAIEIPKADGATAYSVELPKSAISLDNQDGKIRVSTEYGSVFIPTNMLERSYMSEAKNAEIVIGLLDRTALDKESQQLIGNRPLLELKLKVDNRIVEWKNPEAPVTVSIPYTPTAEELKNPDCILIWHIDGGGKAAIVNNSRYDAASKQVVFTTSKTGKFATGFVPNSFEDLESYKWARTAIETIASRGIINGESAQTYNPGTGISRAEFITALINVLELDAAVDNNFDDVKTTDKYYKQIGVAKKLGITAGKSKNRLAPDAVVTRQEMMTLTAKALKIAKKMNESGNVTDLSKFADKSKVASYALESVEALIHNGFVSGSNNSIYPSGITTRAEAAAIIYKIWSK